MPSPQVSAYLTRSRTRPAILASMVFAVAMLTATGLWASTETTVHNFVNYSHGSNPHAGLISDAAGNFYGTTASGGAFGEGSVFKVTANGGPITETVLYSFTGKNDGAAPKASLVFDAAGNLYGTASAGGNTSCLNGCGTVFELSPNPDGTWTTKVLHNFNSADGAVPESNLIFDGAGNLYGTTNSGGTRNLGTVFELIPNGSGWKNKVLHSFGGATFGQAPDGGVVFDQAGNLYGTTPLGGINNSGIVYELSPSGNGWNETVIFKFLPTFGNGFSPAPGVIFDSAGNLYGATARGGDKGCCGTVFELTKAGGVWAETTLYTFQGQTRGDGASPSSGVIFDAAGNLYGGTLTGGTVGNCGGGCGIVYQLKQTGGVWKETILHEFTNASDGAFPIGNVGLDASGNVWGVTQVTSLDLNPYPYIGGTAFELTPSGGSWVETVYTFAATDGNSPRAGLIADGQGNFYGTTTSGGDNGKGSVFELTPNGSGGWNRKMLYSFKAGNDGDDPLGELVMDRAGNLYGTTETGGGGPLCSGVLVGCGTVFELSPGPNGQWKEAVLHSFQYAPDGAYPIGGLAIDAKGNLYGTTANGGDSLYGVVFMLARGPGGTFTESTLYSFSGFNDGSVPFSAVILDVNGNIYGTTLGGGPTNAGTVFELSPAQGGGWAESGIYQFNGADGSAPVGKLSFDPSGNLYGTTSMGGSNACSGGCGLVFKMSQTVGSWIETVLHSFSGGPNDGSSPQAGVLLDSVGNVFGTTSAGGSSGSSSICLSSCGIVFELTPGNGGTWNESVLHNFSGGADGALPQSDLTFDAAGNVYGTAGIQGVGHAGTVFAVTP